MTETDTQTSTGTGSGAATTESRSGAGRIVGGLALSLLSCLLIWVSFPDRGGMYPLLLVAFVPMYVAQYRVLPRRLSAVPMFFAASTYWFMIWVAAWDLLPGLESLTYVVSLLFGAIYAAIAIFDRKFSERTGYRWFIVQVPLWWVALDSLTQENLWDGTNGWLAYRFADATPLIQTVSIVSTPALTFLALMINATVALLILAWIDRRWPQLTSVPVPTGTLKWSVIVAAVVTAVWVIVSLLIYSSLNSRLAQSPTVGVAAIQPSNEFMPSTTFSVGETPNQAEEVQRKAGQRRELTAMTLEAVGQGAELSVWPEETLNYDPRGPQGRWVARLADRTNTTIVTGFIGEEPVAWPDRAAPNMAAAFGPDGQLLGVTYKVHPVLAAGEAWGGTTPQIYPTFAAPFGQLGIIVCFDHDFPNGSPRLVTLTGAQIIANPSWDWGSISSVRWQSVVFRSVENRVPLVKGEAGFDATITDANGEVLALSDAKGSMGEKAVLVADVHLGPRDAPFTVLGGVWLGLLVVLATIARYIWQFILWRRGKHVPSDSAQPVDQGVATVR